MPFNSYTANGNAAETSVYQNPADGDPPDAAEFAASLEGLEDELERTKLGARGTANVTLILPLLHPTPFRYDDGAGGTVATGLTDVGAWLAMDSITGIVNPAIHTRKTIDTDPVNSNQFEIPIIVPDGWSLVSVQIDTARLPYAGGSTNPTVHPTYAIIEHSQAGTITFLSAVTNDAHTFPGNWSTNTVVTTTINFSGAFGGSAVIDKTAGTYYLQVNGPIDVGATGGAAMRVIRVAVTMTPGKVRAS